VESSPEICTILVISPAPSSAVRTRRSDRRCSTRGSQAVQLRSRTACCTLHSSAEIFFLSKSKLILLLIELFLFGENGILGSCMLSLDILTSGLQQRQGQAGALEANLTNSAGNFQKTVICTQSTQAPALAQTEYVTVMIHIAVNFSKHVSQGRAYAIDHNGICWRRCPHLWYALPSASSFSACFTPITRCICGVRLNKTISLRAGC
jgi:hypothetical protein